MTKNDIFKSLEKNVQNPFQFIEVLFWSIFSLIVGVTCIYFSKGENLLLEVIGIISLIFFGGLFYYLFVVFAFHLIARIFKNIKNHMGHYILFFAILGVGLLIYETYHYFSMSGIVTLAGMLFVGLIVKYSEKIWVKFKEWWVER